MTTRRCPCGLEALHPGFSTCSESALGRDARAKMREQDKDAGEQKPHNPGLIHSKPTAAWLMDLRRAANGKAIPEIADSDDEDEEDE